LGWLYLAPVTLLTVDMVRRNVRLIREPNPKHALALFIASNTYLMIILLAASIDAVI
jgi:heme O synthase-like polyprenyltransferase